LKKKERGDWFSEIVGGKSTAVMGGLRGDGTTLGLDKSEGNVGKEAGKGALSIKRFGCLGRQIGRDGVLKNWQGRQWKGTGSYRTGQGQAPNVNREQKRHLHGTTKRGSERFLQRGREEK